MSARGGDELAPEVQAQADRLGRLLYELMHSLDAASARALFGVGSAAPGATTVLPIQRGGTGVTSGAIVQVQEDGAPLTFALALNFGDGIVASYNAANNRIDVTIDPNLFDRILTDDDGAILVDDLGNVLTEG